MLKFSRFHILLGMGLLLVAGCNTPADPPPDELSGTKSTEESPQAKNIDGGVGAETVASTNGGRRWAILVGVNNYARARKLNYCVQDIESLRSRLLLRGFSSSRIKVLCDNADTGHLPIRANIEAELDALLGELDAEGKRLVVPGIAERNDTVLIALSGHGIHLNGRSYFCPADTRFDKPDQTLVPLDRIYKRLEHCPSCFKLMFVDACRNDPRSANNKSLEPSRSMEQFAASLKERVPKNVGTFVLASCSPGQISLEEPRFRHGVFMHFLLAGMDGAADREEGNRNDRVSVFELYQYVNSKTKAWVFENKSGIAQTPTLFVPDEITHVFEFPPGTPGGGGSEDDAEKSFSYLEVVHPDLRSCKLVFTAKTGANINLEKVKRYANEINREFCGKTRVGFNPGRHGRIMTTIEDGWVCWATPLTMHWSKGENDSFLGPADLSLLLRVAISSDGQIQLGTNGPNAREHLLVLAQLGGIDNTIGFDSHSLAKDVYKAPHNQTIDTNEKQTLLALWFANLYRSMAKSKIAKGGPKNGADLHECQMALYNFFNRPITVVHGHLHHVQCDYSWYPEIQRPIDERMNELWSPIANRPDQDAHLSASCELTLSGDMTSALYMHAGSDNRNATYFKATGLKIDKKPDVIKTGEWTTVKLDQENGICSGENRDSSSSEAILYDVAPTRIELSAGSIWSVVQPWFRLATFADVSIDKAEYSPKGQSKREIRPQMWVIKPE